jgi:orotate phosphoribosyltransferase-like protein
MVTRQSIINSARVLELKKAGLSQRVIAERLSLSENTIGRILKRDGIQKSAPKGE